MRFFIWSFGLSILFIGGFVFPAVAKNAQNALAIKADDMTSITTPSFGKSANIDVHLNFPKSPVSDLYAGLLKIMKQSKTLSFSARYKELYPIIKQSYDMPYITSLTVGIAFKTLPSEQQKKLLTLLTAYTTASYVANFNSYNGERFLFGQVSGTGNERIVQTEIDSKTANYTMNYPVRLTPDGWKIVDVLMNGTISQLALQRSEFSSLVVAGGALPLIKALTQKISFLSGGTVQVR